MALDSYANLKTAIANFLARDDLTDDIDDFIELTAADFNRRLSVRQMETKGSDTSGQPRAYSIEGTNFRFSPAPDSTYTARLTYYKAFDAIDSTTTTNHIITNHPDIYLYGSLYFGSTFLRGMDPQTVTQFKGQYEAALQQAEIADAKDKYNGAPLVQRSGININNYDNV